MDSEIDDFSRLFTLSNGEYERKVMPIASLNNGETLLVHVVTRKLNEFHVMQQQLLFNENNYKNIISLSIRVL